jgi:hypothetical protein
LVIEYDGSLIINIKFSIQYTMSNLIINLFLFMFIIVLHLCSSFVFIAGSLPSAIAPRSRGPARQSRVPSVTRHHLAGEARRVPDHPAIEPR